VGHVAAEIGIGEQVLGRWARLAGEGADVGPSGAVLDADERAELERLRGETAELRLDREVLKMAVMTAGFPRENTNLNVMSPDSTPSWGWRVALVRCR
jgi:transposase-like protein